MSYAMFKNLRAVGVPEAWAVEMCSTASRTDTVYHGPYKNAEEAVLEFAQWRKLSEGVLFWGYVYAECTVDPHWLEKHTYEQTRESFNA